MHSILLLWLTMALHTDCTKFEQRLGSTGLLGPASNVFQAQQSKVSWSVLFWALGLQWLIVFSPLIEGGTTHFPILIIRMSIITLFGLWMLNSMKTGVLSLYRVKCYPFMALFIIWTGVTLMWSPYKSPGVQWMVTLVCYGAFVILVVQHAQSAELVRRLVSVVIGMGVFQATLGAIQYFVLGELRAKGTFFNPNFFASYEAVCLILSLSMLFHSGWTSLSRWEKTVLIGSAVSASMALILAQSRGAMLAAVFVIACIGLYSYKRGFILALVLSVLVLGLVPNPLTSRIMQGATYDRFAYTRLEIWKDALHRFQDHPLGMGIGMYKYGSFQYQFPLDEEIIRYGKRAESAHSGYLQIAVELGIVGVGLLLSGLIAWGREAVSTLRCVAVRKERGLLIGLIGGASVLLGHAAVDSVFHEPALVLLLLLCISLVIVMQRLNENTLPASWTCPLSRRLGSKVLTCGLVFLMLGFAVQPAAGWEAFDRGERASREGDYVRALEWFEAAARIDPGQAAYHDAISIVSIHSFMNTRSSKYIDAALEHEVISRMLNPLDPRFANRLGMIHVLIAAESLGKESKQAALNTAAEFFEEARRLNSFSPTNYLELARIRIQQMRAEEAQELLRTALRLEPNFLPGRVLLVELLLQQGHEQAAKVELTTAHMIQSRYANRQLSGPERVFLDVDLKAVGRLFSDKGLQ